LDKVSQQLACVSIIGHGARGHGYGQILPPFAGLILASSMATPLGFEVAALLKADEGIQVGIYHQIDIAPFATVAPVGPTEGDVFLAAEADATVASVASFDVDFGFVEEHLNAPGQITPERYYTIAWKLMQGI